MTSEIKVDTISEQTSANGVTIDGLTIKDGNIIGDVALAGTTPTFTIGDAGAEDAALIFDGNAQDFYVALDDSADDLVIGLGNTIGTTPIMSFDENKDVVIHDGGLTITTADNTDTLTLISTDADANSGPNLRMYRNSSSPADADTIGVVEFEGRNDNSQDVIYSQMRTVVNDVSDGTEDGQIDIKIMNGGSLNMIASFKGPETVINDASIDHDFRVESNGNTHMLFVDGGNDKVGIGTSSPSVVLDARLSTTTGKVAEFHNSGGFGIGFTVADNGGVNTIDSENNQALAFATNGASNERMRINSAGDVLINGTQEYNSLNGRGNLVVGSGSGNEGITIVTGTSNTGGITFADGTSGSAAYRGQIEYQHNNDAFAFATAAAERMRITSTGQILQGVTSSNSVFHSEGAGTANQHFFELKNSGTSAPYGGQIYFSGVGASGADNNTQYFLRCGDTTAIRMFIYSDGDLQNHDNSYGAISDERIKSNITDANSQWNDIKNIKVRNFQRKDDIRDYGADEAKVQLGVIAQELETVSPKLVKEYNPTNSDIISDSAFGTLYTLDDAETQDAVLYTSDDQEVIDGNKNVGDIKTEASKKIGEVKEITAKVKGVNYSILYMKAIKALQEAMTRIETLEAEVTALKG